MALLGAGCTKCGQPYTASGIRVLAQRDEVAFVELVCSTCQTQTMALVTGGTGGVGGSSTPNQGILGHYPSDEPDDESQPQAEVAGPLAADAISETDVLEMRSFLAGYGGDVHDLLGRRDDSDGNSGGGKGRRH
jgi:hypothetical protein